MVVPCKHDPPDIRLGHGIDLQRFTPESDSAGRACIQLFPEQRWNVPLFVTGDQLAIIVLRLVRIVLGKVGDGLVEACSSAEIRRNLNTVATSRMCAGQRLPARPRVDAQARGRD